MSLNPPSSQPSSDRPFAGALLLSDAERAAAGQSHGTVIWPIPERA